MDYLTFRDRMFPHQPGALMGKGFRPYMNFLRARAGISPMVELKSVLSQRMKDIELNQKKRDFAHLLFNESNAERILQFYNSIQWDFD